MAMSTLVAGYESSDDDSQPIPSHSASTLPRLDPDSQSHQEDEDEEDDEQALEQVRRDAFGLSSSNGTTERNGTSTEERKPGVMAAPDVLKEVGRLRGD